MEKSYYAILPANVRYDNRLCANEKLLYSEVTALSNEKGFCWATNSYFADLYKVSKGCISKWVASLVKLGYLKIKLNYKPDTKEVISRHLTLATPPMVNSDDTPMVNLNHTYTSNNDDPMVNLNHTPIVNLMQGNNTLYNNKINNTNNIEKNFEESEFLELNKLEDEKNFTQTESSLKKEKNSAKKEKKTELEKSFEEAYNQFYKKIMKSEGDALFGKWERVALKEIIEKCKKLTPAGQTEIDLWRVIVSIESWQTMEKFWQDKFGIKQLNNNFDSIFYQMKNHRERNKSSNKYMPGLEEAHRINSQKLKDGTFYKNPLEDLQYKS